MEISKLKSEFNNWADTLLKNKREKKLELEKDDIVVSERIVSLNREWANTYVNAINFLKNSIEAYNSKSDKKINGNSLLETPGHLLKA